MVATTNQRLREILCDEGTIDKYFSGLDLPEGVRLYREKNYWYQTSYPIILKRFKETRELPPKEKWAERIAWVYSWISSIPAGGFDREAMKLLSKLEQEYGYVSFQDTYIETYHGSTFPEMHGYTVFSTKNNGTPLQLSDFFMLADKIMHVNGSWKSTLSTTSKILHFTFPEIFPIYDNRIHHLLFGNSQKSYKHYEDYVLGVREFLQTSNLVSYIEKKMTSIPENNITMVRSIELLLFIASQRDNKKKSSTNE